MLFHFKDASEMVQVNIYLQRNLANFKVASSSKVIGETLHKTLERSNCQQSGIMISTTRAFYINNPFLFKV